MLKLSVLSVLLLGALAAYYEDMGAHHIAEVNNRQSNWKAGYNEYLSGKSKEDIQVLCGSRLGNPEKPMIPVKKDDRAWTYLPRSFVAGKDKWRKCSSTINFIKDQSQCGSCWAMSSSAVMSDRTCIVNENWMQDPRYSPKAAGGQVKPTVDRSAEQVLACCKTCGGGCQGGWPSLAMKYWEEEGVVSGGWYHSHCGCEPYTIPTPAYQSYNTPPCYQSCDAGFRKRTYDQDKVHAKSHYTIKFDKKDLPGTMKRIQQDIYDHGPVACDFKVYENFGYYKTGVYDRTTGSPHGGHAIKIIGWGEENGTPFWLINNSWNTTWGDNGQIKFLRGQNLAGMEERCVGGIPKPGEYDPVKLECY